MNQRPVPLRTLAEQLGVHYTALQRHERSGKLPTYKLGTTTVIDADIAEQVRKWHQNNKFKTWPKFPLQDEQKASKD